MERRIKLLMLRVWPDGILADELADHLEHVAKMLREGCQSGDVCPNEGSGWWDTIENEAEPSTVTSIPGKNETTQGADGGWWISVKADYGRRDALGPFVSETEAKTIAGLLFVRTASPELS